MKIWNSLIRKRIEDVIENEMCNLYHLYMHHFNLFICYGSKYLLDWLGNSTDKQFWFELGEENFLL